MASRSWITLSLGALLVAGCADGEPRDDRGFSGPGVQIDVAALQLTGVGDVVWDLEVVNSATETVWQRRVTSTSHGDSAGSASYVGPCEADASPNTVRVWVVGVYADDITTANAGAFAAGAATGAGAVTGTALSFQNPTTVATPLTRQVACASNADAAVQFDVALMRPAQQGFFDVAVSFNDVFCSAKLDCCQPGGDGVCATDGSEDIELLFDATGARARTIVLGLACTAGTASDVDTALYMDPIALDCDVSSTSASFVADVTLNPDAAQPGNLCTPGADGMSACAAVTEAASVDADSYLFQAAVYRGDEPLANGGGGVANKVYWNVALGVKSGISACTLRTSATADDAADPDDGVDGGAIASGSVYPYVSWDVDLDTCGAEQLTFGDPTAAVQARYTDVGAENDTTFAYSFAPSLPEAPDPTPQHVYTATGADQSFVVPAGVTSVVVKLWGAGGGGGGDSFDGGRLSVGGGGGFATGTVAVTPGETLTVVVGAGGVFAPIASVYGGGGGAGSYGGDLVGSGGGRSAVRRGGTELLTAGGGGGGGGEDSPRDGGAGGGLVGADATGGGPSGSPTCGGGGGTQTAGGPRAICNHNVSQSGSFLQGGMSTYCGGGGGGWYGGGSGDHQSAGVTCGGGGGGSGHLDASVTDGVLVGGSGQTPAMVSDTDYQAGVGLGGPNEDAGGPGLVVILY